LVLFLWVVEVVEGPDQPVVKHRKIEFVFLKVEIAIDLFQIQLLWERHFV